MQLTRRVPLATRKRPSAAGVAIPGELRHRVHFGTVGERLDGRDILVVGTDDEAARCVRRLCLDNEVALACSARALKRMSLDQAHVLRELQNENEIRVWTSVRVARLELSERGRCRVVFAPGGPEPASFDDVLFCQVPVGSAPQLEGEPLTTRRARRLAG